VTAPIVVKLGGSLAEAGSIRSWLAVLTAGGAGRCVVVPGGGVFADAVRGAQPVFGFSDGAAHEMALLAMAQYGLLLADLAPILVPAETEVAIAAGLSRHRIPLWLPSHMVVAAPEIAPGWDITSDSLAAWLAGKIGASALILVKSVKPPSEAASPAEMARAGLVDPAFPRFTGGAAFTVACCGPGDEARLEARLGAGSGLG